MSEQEREGFHNLTELWRRLKPILANRQIYRRVYSEPYSIPPAVREKLMVAVSKANQCPPCHDLHRQWALSEGVKAEELDHLSGAYQEQLSEEELAYLATEDMEAVLELIRFGNACSNTYLRICRTLYRNPFRVPLREWTLYLVMVLPINLSRIYGWMLGRKANRLKAGNHQPAAAA